MSEDIATVTAYAQGYAAGMAAVREAVLYALNVDEKIGDGA